MLENGSKDQQIYFKSNEIQIIIKFFYQKYYNWEEFGLDILNDLKQNIFIHVQEKTINTSRRYR